MTDYKRMVSYMYQYENGIKRKNVGFAKVEAKGGQCKITLHMQLLGQLDSIFPTYLIQRGNNNMDLIYLGDTILKNQVMDSRLLADENNIMGSGFSLSDMSGILLFLNDKVFFATVWDDLSIVQGEVLEALRPKKSNQWNKSKEDVVRNAKQDASKAQEVNSSATVNQAQLENPKQESQQFEEYKLPKYMLPGGWKMMERVRWIANNAKEDLLEMVDGNPKKQDEEKDNPDNVNQMVSNQYDVFTNIGPFINNDLFRENSEKESQEQLFEIIEEMNAAEYGEEDFREWDPSVDAAGQEGAFARKFFDHYPRIYPFEDNEILQCVKIEPKDIGLLPKEIWPYSNNSFLLHGFYCYHHLIFAKKKGAMGLCHILGVPGIYHSREQFMAKMFGFEHFKSIRNRDLMQGDFGYWYLFVYP